MSTKKEGIKKENPPNIEREQKIRKQKWVIFFCCGGLFLFLLILAGIFFIRLFFVSGDTNVPLPIPSFKPSPSPTIISSPSNIGDFPSSYPIPEDCQDVGNLNSKPLEISLSNPGLFHNIDIHNYKVYG